MSVPGPARATEDAREKARRQLRTVLRLLGLLDMAVLVFVLLVAWERSAWGLSTVELLAVIVAGISFVLLTRIWLAVRLHARRGNLF